MSWKYNSIVVQENITFPIPGQGKFLRERIGRIQQQANCGR